MNYKEVLTNLKNNQLSHLCLFYGMEHYLMENTVNTIKEKILGEGFEDLNYQMMDGKEINVDAIINACETLPFMTEQRIVVVKNLESFSGKRKNISEEDEKRLSEYLANIPRSTYLIFLATEDIDKRKKIIKDIGKYGHVVEFNKLSEQDMHKWIGKLFGKYQKKIDEKNIGIFIEMTGYLDRNSDKNLKDVENEIKKISSYVGERSTVVRNDIELLAPKNIENNIFELVESIGEKKGDKALLLLSDMLMEGEPEVRILYMITRHFRMLFQVKLMEAQGYTPMAIAPKLGLQQFVVKKYVKQAKNFEVKLLKYALEKCLQTDEYIKKGKIDPRLGMELLISEFAP